MGKEMLLSSSILSLTDERIPTSLLNVMNLLTGRVYSRAVIKGDLCETDFVVNIFIVNQRDYAYNSLSPSGQGVS